MDLLLVCLFFSGFIVCLVWERFHYLSVITIRSFLSLSQALAAPTTPSGPMEALRTNIPPILYLLITFLFALAVGKFML